MRKIFEESKYTKWYVDENGCIFSSSTYNNRDGKIKPFKPNVCTRGYLYARTRSGNRQIHRLVAELFIPNPERKPCVNHKDGNKHNNAVSNLEWVTYKENTAHAISNGLNTLFNKNEGANLKYTLEQCRQVIDRVNSGMTYIQAGSVHNMPYSTVAHLIRGSRRLI